MWFIKQMIYKSKMEGYLRQAVDQVYPRNKWYPRIKSSMANGAIITTNTTIIIKNSRNTKESNEPNEGVFS